MKTVFFMRGLPGSGKSTAAKKLAPGLMPYATAGPDGPVAVSADYFFNANETAEYAFDPKAIGLAHAQCRADLLAAISEGRETIVVDNTHSQAWEYADNLNASLEAGYRVRFVDIYDNGQSDEALAARNSHGVPLAAIRRMRARWEF